MNAALVIDTELVSSKLFTAMNDGTPNDINSGTLDFTIWCARSHVLYFSEAVLFI